MPEQQAAFARYRVHVDDGVLGFIDGGGEHLGLVVEAAAVHLCAFGAVVVVVAVQRPEAVGEGLELGRQVAVGRRGVGPHRVAAVGRNDHAAQHRVFGKGVKESDIGVPGVRAAATLRGIEFEDLGA